MRRTLFLVLLLTIALAGCRDGGLETRTFQLSHLQASEAQAIIEPYVYTERERNPGRFSATRGAITVRETPDNLERIGRVLEEYDRPQPTVMLHFQVIAADGPAEDDPAIEAVTRELRRLFRFQGYRLLAETQAAGIQGTSMRQTMGPGAGGAETFGVESSILDVRAVGATPTVTLGVSLWEPNNPPLLQTRVTVPIGHSVVLGSAQSGRQRSALILVVRAEVMDAPGG